ncbi:MAG: deoxyguanosinetriphosphate triphosphohydrolase [Chthonomonas sp.]|nr:deoxyguanosinetriphosphate triphosphohydrolase [Chthonomonas sp.]
MSHSVRLSIEAREHSALSEFAMRASESSGRVNAVDEDPVRTCFQRDRDRILHSKAFRRLKHKTQVFIDPEGDHFRTRMTHTLEVSQIARTIGRALQLNEDLIEAIALGHDVGHTPFGHAGESALDEALQEHPSPDGPTEFRHYDQSLRVLDVLEPLNLTQEVRAGISGHSKGRKDLCAADGEPTSTLEAAVVRISDRIAYLNHDLDDALRSKMIAEVPAELAMLGPNHGARIGAMVENVISHSMGVPAIRLSDQMLETMNWMKEWLFTEVYTQYPIVFKDIPKAKGIVKALFSYYRHNPLPTGFEGTQGALDYVAGMTDRFAMAEFRAKYMPATFRHGLADES